MIVSMPFYRKSTIIPCTKTGDDTKDRFHNQHN